MCAADFLISPAPRRRIAAVALLALVVLCAATSTAGAGTYTVVACDGSGRLDSWTPIQNDGYGAAYAGGCPRPDGLVARSVGRADASLAPYGSTGAWLFTSPDGTRIVGLSGQYKGGAYWPWVSGISSYEFGFQYCFTWCHNGWPQCYVDCPAPITSWRLLDLEGLSQRTIAVQTVCQGPTGCRRDGPKDYGAAYLSNIVVRLADDWLPAVHITGGTLVAPGWKRGSQTLAFDLRDNTGIRTVRTLVDGVLVSREDRPCDGYRVVPCGNAGSTASIDTLRVFPSDGRHVITVEGTDGGYNVASDSRTVWVDNTPPAQPQNLQVAGLGRWQRVNSFVASWTSPRAAGAPLVATRYELCRVGSTSACRTGQQTGSASSIRGLHVPGDGQWSLRIWQADAAGNADRNRSAVASPLRLDTTAPAVVLSPPDPADPTRLHVSASDATSGLSDVDVEIRRQGSDAWIAMPVAGEGSDYSAVVDDERLPRGIYDVRAHAIDAAGNERSVTGFADGRPATIALPARIVSELVSGQPRRHGRGARLARTVTTTLGRRPVLRGRLTTPGRNPIAHAPIEVWRRVDLPGAPWRRTGEIQTSEHGRFVFRVPRGPNSVLRFRYPGSPTIRGADSRVVIRVRASTTMYASPRHAVNGGVVRFHGRLRGGRIPAGGKLVELQVFTRRRWRTFAQPRANRRGRWSYDYRFETIAGRVTFRFRARIRREEAYPYAFGRSRTIHVWVRGL